MSHLVLAHGKYLLSVSYCDDENEKNNYLNLYQLISLGILNSLLLSQHTTKDYLDHTP